MTTLNFLIVDDSPVIRLMLTQALVRHQVDPDHIWDAESFHEAVELFDEVHPDVVFLDISLPEGRPSRSGPGSFLDYLTGPAAHRSVGDAAVRHMRDRNPAVRIVLCTGNPPEDPRVQELLAEGATRLVEKPIDLEVIGAVLRSLDAPPR
ncbi:MAG TPA: response regulator [Thermoplasmata archaeon]|nr:response regulator [Thermoplasmata archaeon]